VGWLLVLLALGLGVRLYRITNPLLEAHSMRQADTACIARNLYRHGYHFFYPAVDFQGPELAPFGGSEPPFYQFLVALLYQITGVREIVGRLVSVAFALATAVVLYRLAVEEFTLEPGAALISVLFFLLTPVNIFYHRAFLPDPMMVFFATAAIWGFLRWARTDHQPTFWAATASLTVAATMKPIILCYGPALLYLGWRKYRGSLWRQPHVWASLALVVGAVGLWSWHAARLWQVSKYGMVPLGLGWGPLALGPFLALLSHFGWRLVLLLTPWGLVLWLGGVGASRKYCEKDYFLLLWMAGALSVYFAIPALTHAHPYYLLSAFPPAALLIALGWQSGRQPVRSLSGGALVASLALTFPLILPWYEWNPAELEAANEIRTLSQPTDLIMVPSGGPGLLYYCDRRGWIWWPENATDPAQQLEALQRHGADYVVLLRPRDEDPLAGYLREHGQLVVSRAQYQIFQIGAPTLGHRGTSEMAPVAGR